MKELILVVPGCSFLLCHPQVYKTTTAWICVILSFYTWCVPDMCRSCAPATWGSPSYQESITQFVYMYNIKGQLIALQPLKNTSKVPIRCLIHLVSIIRSLGETGSAAYIVTVEFWIWQKQRLCNTGCVKIKSIALSRPLACRVLIHRKALLDFYRF